MSSSPPSPDQSSAGEGGTSVTQATKKRSLLVGVVGLIALIAGILGLAYGGRVIFGSDAGGSCESLTGCKPGMKCIGKKCYRACDTDADCKDGWRCGSTTVSITPGGNASKGYKLESMNICFSPEKMAPVDERERKAALTKKKQDVVRAVIVRLTTTPPQLTSAEFDAAWETIPEADRSSKSTDELAKQVIERARATK